MRSWRQPRFDFFFARAGGLVMVGFSISFESRKSLVSSVFALTIHQMAVLR
jgi:hypothetical protein